MSSYIRYEILLFMQAAVIGAALLLCYDFLKVFRRILPHPAVAIICQDVIFWIASAFVLFCTAYRYNQGIMRSFAFLGNLCGALVCHVTLSPIFCKILGIILSVPVTIVKKMINGLLFLLKRCKIFMYNFGKTVVFGGKQYVFRLKRGREVEKIKKKGKPKKNSE